MTFSELYWLRILAQIIGKQEEMIQRGTNMKTTCEIDIICWNESRSANSIWPHWSKYMPCVLYLILWMTVSDIVKETNHKSAVDNIWKSHIATEYFSTVTVWPDSEGWMELSRFFFLFQMRNAERNSIGEWFFHFKLCIILNGSVGICVFGLLSDCASDFEEFDLILMLFKDGNGTINRIMWTLNEILQICHAILLYNSIVKYW